MSTTVLNIFEYEENEMIGNGNYMYLLKFILKIREITSGELIFGEFEQFRTNVLQRGSKLVKPAKIKFT